jgi:hypothetical protein
MANFTNTEIKDTYQRVLQIDSGVIQNGLGQTISASINSLTGSFKGDLAGTASFATSASYAISASVEIIKEISSSYADLAGGLTGQPSIFVTNLTASGNVSSSLVSSTSSFGTYLGDGSQLTGIAAGFWTGSGEKITKEGDVKITGSLVISSSNSTASLELYGSGSEVFKVIGNQGTLFSVDDDLKEIIFTANDISGLPVLQASASGEVYLGKSPQSLYKTSIISATSASATQSLCILNTSSYDGAFFDYTVHSASNARAGSIMAVWSASVVRYNETSTTDIGDTSAIDFNVIISSSGASLVSVTDSSSPNTWKVKTIIKAI